MEVIILTSVKFKSKGLTCANCASKIEKELNMQNTISSATVNPINEEIVINYNDNQKNENQDELIGIQKLVEVIVNKYEKGVEISQLNEEIDTEEDLEDKIFGISKIKFNTYRLISSIILFTASFFVDSYLEIIFLILAFIISGYEVVMKAISNLLKGELFDENFLMTLASIGAFYLKDYKEACGIMIFYCLGEIFQDRAVSSSKRSIKNLLNIKPEYAVIVKNGIETKVKPSEVNINDNIIVKPGERIPLDGVIVKGDTTIDNKALTGESLPIHLNTSDEILSGSVNLTSTVTIKVSKRYNESTINRILTLVKDSSNNKAQTEKFITKFAKVYTPVVVMLAIIIAFIIPILLKEPFNIWIHKALTLLVISCPCALVISIPLGYFAGIGLASKNGILIKGGNFLEALRNSKNIVLDKTGTITEGDFKVSKISAIKTNEDELLKLIYQIEKDSPHPIAKSIIKYIEINKPNLLKNMLIVPQKVEEVRGKGLVAFYKNKTVYIGNDSLISEIGLHAENSNATILHIGEISDNKATYLGYVSVEDKVKKEAPSFIGKLKSEGFNNITMLTGDGYEIASKVAKSLDLTDFKAKLLPEDKLKYLKEILDNKKGKETTIFVGDGLNDTPVLKLADIGISMGNLGSSAAIEASDIVITDDNLLKITKAIDISKLTYKVVTQNIVLSLGIKIIIMILGIIGIANIWMAIFADVGVALLAILNSTRLIFKKI